MKRLILSIVFLQFSICLFAQTGPGGIGASNGTSNLILWLDANSGTFSDSGTTPCINGGSLQQWNDKSGHNNHSTQTVVARQPTWNTSILNGFPAVNFSSTDQNYILHQITTNPSSSDYSFFAVFNSTAIGQNNLLQQLSGTGIGRTHYLINDASTKSFIGGSTQSSTISFTANSWTIGGTNYDANGASSSISFYQNGSFGGNVGSITPESATGNWLTGVNKNLSAQWLDADVTEIIFFNSLLNNAQLIIIQNYLAAKYGLLLTANDLYNEDDVGNGNYDYDVAGIGRVDASNIHNDAQGTGIVRILNPTGLDDDEFLIWGHDNGVLQATETTDVPASVQARLARTWRVSERNAANTSDVDVGAVDMRWDLNGLGSVTASDLRLLIDTDNDGLFNDETPISGATDLGGGIFEFASVPGGATGITNNRRITLGTINSSQTPLPIELVHFNAALENELTVKLEWQTASEINNDFFTIERSKNGLDWEEVSKIDGAGNSTALLSYSTIDENPYRGISYYRLKQTDFDGQFEYSDIRSVTIKQNTTEVVIYPNPVNNQITIQANDQELQGIKIFNTLGQDVTNLTKQISKTDNSVIIDLSNLANGIYSIKTVTTANIVYKQ